MIDTKTITSDSRAAAIRAGLDHPIVDGDAHMVEYIPVFLDFLKQVGGPRLVERYETRSRQAKENRWHQMSPGELANHRISRPPFWAVAAETSTSSASTTPSSTRRSASSSSTSRTKSCAAPPAEPRT
jgi:hypothetical protein